MLLLLLLVRCPLLAAATDTNSVVENPPPPPPCSSLLILKGDVAKKWPLANDYVTLLLSLWDLAFFVFFCFLLGLGGSSFFLLLLECDLAHKFALV